MHRTANFSQKPQSFFSIPVCVSLWSESSFLWPVCFYLLPQMYWWLRYSLLAKQLEKKSSTWMVGISSPLSLHCLLTRPSSESCSLWALLTLPEAPASDYDLPFIYNEPSPPPYLTAVRCFPFYFFHSSDAKATHILPFNLFIFIQPHHSPSLKKARMETQTWQKAEDGAGCRGHGGMLFTDLLTLDCLDYFPVEPWITSPWIAPPKWTVPSPLIIL